MLKKNFSLITESNFPRIGDTLYSDRGFPGRSDGKESACNMGDPGLIPRWGRSPGEGNGNPLQYSCLKTSRGRGAWRAVAQEAAKSCTQLSN